MTRMKQIDWLQRSDKKERKKRKKRKKYGVGAGNKKYGIS